ncbi:MAG: DUF732 domain-containing protein [Actinomycetota bacterium]|uniref:DUF732 domain-containing protein n=1 Tax=Mycobacterium lentiflavum TaxID=141349 RepID=A0ABY3V1G2_MYCLN|nr:DUF732 domain-containing protein [Mycobacterium lentiflavum]MEE3062829.1 DUF732 domain-containing protein [Actinomycetota bacterium]ULP43468.1 DUF732 domain-containing protein [Mycobacterium lentiflavum]
MKAVAAAHGWVWMFRQQPLPLRVLTAVAGLLAVAAAFGSPPAEADANADDSFIDALNHAGVDFGQPGNAMAVGESICPMLAQPGGSFAGAVTSVRRQGMSPAMAQMFTTIAIQSYCPQAMANLASGTMPNMPGANMPGGLPNMPGATMPGGMPNVPGVMPNMPGVMPNMPGGAVPNLPQITGPGI